MTFQYIRSAIILHFSMGCKYYHNCFYLLEARVLLFLLLAGDITSLIGVVSKASSKCKVYLNHWVYHIFSVEP